MMRTINKENIVSIQSILPKKLMFDTSDTDIEFLQKKINELNKWYRYDYKYGSGWFDYWYLSRLVKSMNVVLLKYSIEIV